MMNRLKRGLLATAILAALAPATHAACPADGATPFFASTIDPNNGFSRYVEDAQGLALAPCLDPNFCFFDPPIAGNAFSEQIGFGAEAFWWLADSRISTTDSGGGAVLDAIVVMAAELAFNTNEPQPGEQFPFTRLRLRMDIRTPGIYTITHPFGRQTYILPNAGVRVVNDTFDFEFTPDGVGKGRVGPWLTWDTFPNDPLLDAVNNDGIDDFVGDGATLHVVKGSPCGNNLFRIEAVDLEGKNPINIDPGDQDGDGSTSSITEVLFTVSGQVFPESVETPLTVDGASYSRDATGAGRLNVFATSPATASVDYDTTVDGANTAATQVPMVGDGAGRFYGTQSVAAGDVVPASVEVVATNTAQPGDATAVRVATVHDLITVTQADYDSVGKSLTVSAASSDQFSPPTLTAVGFADLAGGTLTITDLNVAPATVTVQSSVGGTTTVPVRVINP